MMFAIRAAAKVATRAASSAVSSGAGVAASRGAVTVAAESRIPSSLILVTAAALAVVYALEKKPAKPTAIVTTPAAIEVDRESPLAAPVSYRTAVEYSGKVAEGMAAIPAQLRARLMGRRIQRAYLSAGTSQDGTTEAYEAMEKSASAAGIPVTIFPGVGKPLRDTAAAEIERALLRDGSDGAGASAAIEAKVSGVALGGGVWGVERKAREVVDQIKKDIADGLLSEDGVALMYGHSRGSRVMREAMRICETEAPGLKFVFASIDGVSALMLEEDGDADVDAPLPKSVLYAACVHKYSEYRMGFRNDHIPDSDGEGPGLFTPGRDPVRTTRSGQVTNVELPDRHTDGHLDSRGGIEQTPENNLTVALMTMLFNPSTPVSRDAIFTNTLQAVEAAALRNREQSSETAINPDREAMRSTGPLAGIFSRNHSGSSPAALIFAREMGVGSSPVTAAGGSKKSDGPSGELA